MKKTIGALALLLLIFGATLYNAHYLDGIIHDLNLLVDDSQRHAEAGDLDAALKSAQNATDLWAEKDSYTHVLIRHTEIDSTTDAFYELLRDLYVADTAAARGSYEKLRAHLQSLSSIEHISLGSVF